MSCVRYDRAWTLPAWLDRVLPRISLEGELHDEQRAPEPASHSALDFKFT